MHSSIRLAVESCLECSDDVRITVISRNARQPADCCPSGIEQLHRDLVVHAQRRDHHRVGLQLGPGQEGVRREEPRLESQTAAIRRSLSRRT